MSMSISQQHNTTTTTTAAAADAAYRECSVHIVAPFSSVLSTEFSMDPFSQHALQLSALLRHANRVKREAPPPTDDARRRPLRMWRTVEYSNGESQSCADVKVQLLSLAELEQMGRLVGIAPEQLRFTTQYGNEALQREFQQRLHRQLLERCRPGDVVAHTYGPMPEVQRLLPKCLHVETHVGYQAEGCPGILRMYNSHSWMYWDWGRQRMQTGQKYAWVAPMSFDTQRWPGLEVIAARQHQPKQYHLMMGRITEDKGINTVVALARAMPDQQFLIVGPGDANRWTSSAGFPAANLQFRGPVSGDARHELLLQAKTILMPTEYVEPGGTAGLEGMMCGVPLIASAFGCFTDNVVHGETGYLCRTLADWMAALRKAPVALDRMHMARLVRQRNSNETVAMIYDMALQQMCDLTADGWYEAGTHDRSLLLL